MLLSWEKSSMPSFRRFLMTQTQEFKPCLCSLGQEPLHLKRTRLNSCLLPNCTSFLNFAEILKHHAFLPEQHFPSWSLLVQPLPVSMSQHRWETQEISVRYRFPKGLRIYFSISPLIGSSRDWIPVAAVTSNSVQVMSLPYICSCWSSPTKIYADLEPLGSRSLYRSTYLWFLLWRHKT